jgi:hypothetical protein
MDSAFKSVVGATHYYHVCPPFSNIAKIEDVTECAKQFYDVVKEAHGGLNISPVLLALITSTDDSSALYHCVEQQDDTMDGYLSRVRPDLVVHCFMYEKDY